MVELFANSGDPDQTPRSAASDLGLHCLPITLLGVSRLEWVNSSNMGCAMHKRVLVGHVRTAKAQISLRIHSLIGTFTVCL